MKIIAAIGGTIILFCMMIVYNSGDYYKSSDEFVGPYEIKEELVKLNNLHKKIDDVLITGTLPQAKQEALLAMVPYIIRNKHMVIIYGIEKSYYESFNRDVNRILSNGKN